MLNKTLDLKILILACYGLINLNVEVVVDLENQEKKISVKYETLETQITFFDKDNSPNQFIVYDSNMKIENKLSKFSKKMPFIYSNNFRNRKKKTQKNK